MHSIFMAPSVRSSHLPPFPFTILPILELTNKISIVVDQVCLGSRDENGYAGGVFCVMLKVHLP